MFSYFAKIRKSFEYQSVLKVYYSTKNRQKWANLAKIRKKCKLLIISIIYSFYFSCFHYLVPGLGTKKSLVNR